MTFGFGNQHSIQLSYGRLYCILRIGRDAVHSTRRFFPAPICPGYNARFAIGPAALAFGFL